MKYVHFEEIDSTNSYLKREYQNLDNLTFVSASFQTEGHGRYSRKWNANKGESLLFSVLIKDKRLIENFSHISMITAYVVAKFLERMQIKDVSIKWPNDVYVAGKKICGILLEGKIPEYIVIGVGINVLQEFFPNDLRHPATSIKLEGKNIPEINISALEQAIFEEFGNLFTNFDYNFDVYTEFLASHNYLKDKNVIIKQDNKEIKGTVVGLDSGCNLLIDQNKEIIKVNSGEIEVLWATKLIGFQRKVT